MHIHSNPMSSQMMGLGATQRTQHAVETKRAAEVVRKKLTAFAASDDDEDISRVAAYSEAEAQARQKRSQSDPEAFRSVYFSFTV
jgi:type IV secretory pathway VirJ component